MTKIKLCGLRRSDDIDYANALLPEYVGFVFSQKSSRYVTPQEACLLRQQLDERITSVGVFVDESPEVIANLLEQGIIGVAQLHGQETEETIRMLQQRTGRAVMKAFCIRDAADVAAAVFSGGGSDTGECKGRDLAMAALCCGCKFLS